MNRLSLLILLLGAFASLAVAASAPTFCKCTCFTNSTIIEIKPKSKAPGGSSRPPSQHQPPSGGDTTTDPDDSNNNDNKQDDDPDALSFAGLDDIIAAAEDDDEIMSIPLDDDDDGDDDDFSRRRRRQHQRRHEATFSRRAKGSSSSPSCSQCNRNFCLSQSLPICKGAADKDVSTMCFQRDSRKDQFIVWGFILGTAGLLGWAAVQKVADMRQSGGGIPGVIGRAGGGGGGGGPPRGRREGGILPLGRGALGSTGTDGGRGAYAAVAGHSRESSLQTN